MHRPAGWAGERAAGVTRHVWSGRIAGRGPGPELGRAGPSAPSEPIGRTVPCLAMSALSEGAEGGPCDPHAAFRRREVKPPLPESTD